MARLDLHITNTIINGIDQTCTMIGNKKGFLFPNQIVFHNDTTTPNAMLQVDFDIDMDTSGPSKRTIRVRAGGEEFVKFKTDDKKGTKVKYTATIHGAAPEDPIIIID